MLLDESPFLQEGGEHDLMTLVQYDFCTGLELVGAAFSRGGAGGSCTGDKVLGHDDLSLFLGFLFF